MKNLIKRMLNGLLLFCILFLLLTFLFHQYLLRNESKILKPTGTLVNDKGTNLHLYTEGDGEDTLVFMSGLGTAAPQYEFKPLYELFVADYTIAVMDRAGYGYSELSQDSRTLDTIVEQTRATLKANHLSPPYILVPHSISGLEALYWAQHYPEEVKAIIGLDIGTPNEYISYEIKAINKVMLYGYEWATKIGLHRLIPSLAYNEAVLEKGSLNETEIEQFLAISYKQGFNKNMRNEMLMAKHNSELLLHSALPVDTPLLLIDAYLDKQSEAAIKNFHDYSVLAEQFIISDIIQLQSSHSLYLHVPQTIYEATTHFITQLP